MPDILTYSRLSALRQCPRKHYLRYELGLARERTADYLRLGTAYHLGLALRNSGEKPEIAIQKATEGYATAPRGVDEYDWAIEREIVAQLLAGYFWRYSNDDVKIVSIEHTFKQPLTNPFTRRRNRKFVIAGKIDAIARLTDGRHVILEYKTAGEDINPNSDYWIRLRRDPQISQYAIAARELGYDISTVIYDVTRKPTIAPLKATPPDKRKYTKDGRLHASQREQNETPQEYGARLLADIGERPDYYYQRREVPILDDELAEFHIELWQQAQQLVEMRRANRWYRNVHRYTCSTCEFAGPCLGGVPIDPTSPPQGFVILRNLFQELENDT